MLNTVNRPTVDFHFGRLLCTLKQGILQSVHLLIRVDLIIVLFWPSSETYGITIHNPYILNVF